MKKSNLNLNIWQKIPGENTLGNELGIDHPGFLAHFVNIIRKPIR